MSSKSKKADKTAIVKINSDVVRKIHQHARSNSKMEVCGVLIGSDADGATAVEACIPGVNASQGGAHVTFTQDTWEHIYKIKDRDYPNDRIVGWYHSHPGFGVFLSDHDTFIHKNFFSSPLQVAWVYDPHSDEEGCFGWVGERIERLSDFTIADRKGGERAGETGKSEPTILGIERADEPSYELADEMQASEDDVWPLLSITVKILSYISVFLLGALMVWYLFPRTAIVGIPVDPTTGLPLTSVPQDQGGMSSSQMHGGEQNTPKQMPSQAGQNSGNAKGSNAQR